MHGTPVICYRAHAATKEPYRVVTLAERVCGCRDEARVYTARDDRTMCRRAPRHNDHRMINILYWGAGRAFRFRTKHYRKFLNAVVYRTPDPAKRSWRIVD